MKLSESMPAAVGGLVLVVLVIVLTFGLRPVWWSFIDVFFLFMMAFTFFVSVFIARYNRRAQKKLQACAMVCGVLMVLSLIMEYVLFQALS